MDGQQRVILGIDPGTMVLGFGVILIDRKKVHFVDMGVLDLRKEKDHFAKLSSNNGSRLCSEQGSYWRTETSGR